MLDINKTSHHSSERANAGIEQLRRLVEAGEPVTIAVNGAAEFVLSDARSQQQLLELAERAVDLEKTRQALAEADAGLGRPVEELLTEMRRMLDESKGR